MEGHGRKSFGGAAEEGQRAGDGRGIFRAVLFAAAFKIGAERNFRGQEDRCAQKPYVGKKEGGGNCKKMLTGDEQWET